MENHFIFLLLNGNDVLRGILNTSNKIYLGAVGEYNSTTKISDINWIFEYTKTTD